MLQKPNADRFGLESTSQAKTGVDCAKTQTELKQQQQQRKKQSKTQELEQSPLAIERNKKEEEMGRMRWVGLSLSTQPETLSL